MIHVQCEQCGLINRLAVENCDRCGAELKDATQRSTPATVDERPRPFDLETSEPAPEEFRFPPVIREFDGLGAVLNPSISLFTSNFWLITKIVVVIFAPFEIFKALSVGAKKPGWQVGIGIIFLGLFCKALAAPSLIYALATVMRTGVAPTLNEAFRWGLSRIGKLVACAVMVWFLEGLGFICLIIPGIILSLAFELVYPMAALENRGPVEILKRSYNMTKGHRLNIFLASLVFGLLLGAASIPTTGLATILLAEGVTFWPLHAALAMGADILSEGTTILSLVIYISIVSPARSEYSIASAGPPPPPGWE
jgi:uncharacterized membrane protein